LYVNILNHHYFTLAVQRLLKIKKKCCKNKNVKTRFFENKNVYYNTSWNLDSILRGCCICNSVKKWAARASIVDKHHISWCWVWASEVRWLSTIILRPILSCLEPSQKPADSILYRVVYTK